MQDEWAIDLLGALTCLARTEIGAAARDGSMNTTEAEDPGGQTIAPYLGPQDSYNVW